MAWERGSYEIVGGAPPSDLTLSAEKADYTLTYSPADLSIDYPSASGVWERGPYDLAGEPAPNDLILLASKAAYSATFSAVSDSPFPPVGTGAWERGPYEIFGAPPPGSNTLDADKAVFTIGYSGANLIIMGGGPGPTPDPLYLAASKATYLTAWSPSVLSESDILEAERADYLLSYSGANFIVVTSMLSWDLNAGEGTVIKCRENPAYNGTVDENDWDTTPYNNKRWPINEGTGALLNEVLTGDDTYDATIQNYTDNWT